MNSDIRQLLTAYVLGEADQGETARIEALLAEDSEQGEALRAERARLEGTIALVRTHAAPDLALSDARRDELMVASGAGGEGVLVPQPPAAGRVVPFHRRPVFAAAAALFVVAGLGVALLATQPGALPMFEMNAQREDATVDSRAGERRFQEGLAASEDALPSTRPEAAKVEAERASLTGMGYESAPVDRLEDFDIETLGYLGSGTGGGGEPQAGGLLRELGYAAPDASDGADLDAPESPFSQGQDDAFVNVTTAADPATAANEGWNVAPVLSNEAPEEAHEALGHGGAVGGANSPGSKNDPFRAWRAKVLSDGAQGPGVANAPGANPPTSGAPGSQPRAGAAGPDAEEPATLERRRQVESEKGGLFFYEDGPDGDFKARTENVFDAPLDELLGRLGYVDEDDAGSGDFFLGEDHDGDDRAVFGLEHLGDFDAMRAYERELMRGQGLEPNDAGLRRLLEGFGYVESGYDGPVDTPELLDARWKLFGEKVREARRQAMAQRIDALLADTCRRPGESLRDMFFRHWGTRPYTKAADDPVSTFAADVDTSSYTLARKMLDSGVLPTAAQIRPEEWINYFDAELPEPAEGETFRITTEIAPNPFHPNQLGEPTWLLRVGLQGETVEEHERSGLALTFVVDTSGSMGDGNRIELVRNAMRQLLTKLDGRDALAIVAFNNSAREVIPMTSATDRGRIEAAISSLGSNGGTNVEGGLTLGYALASAGYDSERENRVVLLSDGVGNIGETDQEALLAKVEGFRTDKRIYLNTIGVGLGNHNDEFLEQLANKGDGVNDYVDTPLEARRAFVENFTGAFQTIARDVKIQVAFDPAQIGEYRLVGYENRAVADRGFRDDRVDGGEVGAGHSVVAIYELRGVNLGYSESTPDYELGTVSVRYKRPGNDEAAETAIEIAEGISFSDTAWTFDAAPIGLRKNVLVARTAEILKRSHHARGSSFDVLADQIAKVANASTEEEFRSFAGLFARNRAAIEALVRPPSPAEAKLDELKQLRYELELEKTTVGEPDPKQVEQLTKRIDALAEELRRVLLDGVTQNAPTPPTGGEER